MRKPVYYMEILLTILILTLVVSLTSVLTRLSPVQIPLPLIQIAAGASTGPAYIWSACGIQS